MEGAWYLVVDTSEPLSFAQNILFSKLFPSDRPDIIEHVKDGDDSREDLAHIKGDFVLLENEVINARLRRAHYSLSLIEHCASCHELSELFSQLRVKASMVYPRSLSVEYTGPDSVET